MSTPKITDQVLSAIGQASEQLIELESDSHFHPSEQIKVLNSSVVSRLEKVSNGVMSDLAFLDLIPANAYFH